MEEKREFAGKILNERFEVLANLFGSVSNAVGTPEEIANQNKDLNYLISECFKFGGWFGGSMGWKSLLSSLGKCTLIDYFLTPPHLEI